MKLVCKIGLNDFKIKDSRELGISDNDYYLIRSHWYHMLDRINDNILLSDDWVHFSDFVFWAIDKQYKNTHLDKDILYPNNKIYSPETSCFIDQSLNKLFQKQNKIRKYNFPQGVRLNYSKYEARCNNGSGCLIKIGRYNSIKEAYYNYVKYKISIAVKHAKIIYKDDKSDKRVISGLRRHVIKLIKSKLYI